MYDNLIVVSVTKDYGNDQNEINTEQRLKLRVSQSYGLIDQLVRASKLSLLVMV